MVGVWKAHYPNHLCYLQLGCELLIVYIILYCTLVVAIIQITHNWHHMYKRVGTVHFIRMENVNYDVLILIY